MNSPETIAFPKTDSEGTQGSAFGRRHFLHGAGSFVAASSLGSIAMAQGVQRSVPNGQDYVSLPVIQDMYTEPADKAPGPFEAPDQRIGFAIVGLGHLAINQILPAFGKTKLCKPVALVSGDANKAGKIAAQYGIKFSVIYGYADFEKLSQNAETKAVDYFHTATAHRSHSV